jgi:hypothetical protein
MTCHVPVRASVAPQRPVSAVQTITCAVEAVSAAWRARRERLWIGLVAIPLAMTATGLLNQWWTWPVLLACAWACTRSWRWLWLLSLELGFVGAMWAAVGAAALARLPNDRLLVGAIWAAFPLALAGAGATNATGTLDPRRTSRCSSDLGHTRTGPRQGRWHPGLSGRIGSPP